MCVCGRERGRESERDGQRLLLCVCVCARERARNRETAIDEDTPNVWVRAINLGLMYVCLMTLFFVISPSPSRLSISTSDGPSLSLWNGYD